MDKLEKSVAIVLKECMGLKRNESIIIVYDNNKVKLKDVFLEQAKKITNSVEIMRKPIGKVNGEEPPDRISKALNKADVVLLITTKSLSHTKARRVASENGTRIASMPGLSEEMGPALDVNYKDITKLNRKIAQFLKCKKNLTITTKLGTNLRMRINKSMFTDNGIYNKKGDFGNLPAGESGFAPVEGSTNGILIIDKSMSGIGKLNNPIKMLVKDGFVTKINGKSEATKLDWLLKHLKSKSVYNIAEFSIGTNNKARVTGIPLEDEKVLGTIHVAIGDNTSYPGGNTKAPTHLDGVVSGATVEVDGNVIMEEGKLMV